MAAGQRQRRRQRAERRAGVAEEQIGLLDRKRRRRAAHAEGVRPQPPSPADAERLAAPRACTRCRRTSSRSRISVSPSRQGRQQQHAVGDALGAGQAHRAGSARQRGKVEITPSGSARPGRRQANRARHRAARAPWRTRLRARRRRRPAARGAAPAARPGRHRVRASSAVRLARQMSRHISGWLLAMRVKSRKPPAAKPKSWSRCRGWRGHAPGRRPAGAAGG